MLVSAHVQLTPCKWLINISLKLYFKSQVLFHKAEENPVNKSFPLGLAEDCGNDSYGTF